MLFSVSPFPPGKMQAVFEPDRLKPCTLGKLKKLVLHREEGPNQLLAAKANG